MSAVPETIDKEERYQDLHDNAVRLRNDAEFLLAFDRQASAYYLAVVAAEEIGKFVMLHWNDIVPDADLMRQIDKHIPKQFAFSLLFYSEVIAPVYLAIADDLGIAVAGNKLASLKAALMYVADHPDDDEINQQIEVQSLDRIRASKHKYLLGMALSHGWQDAKHSAIYSDPKEMSLWDANDPRMTVDLIDALDDAFELLLVDNGLHIKYTLGLAKHFDADEIKDQITSLKDKLKMLKAF